MEQNNAVITPYDVTGEIDCNRLIDQFGTDQITPELLDRIRNHSGRLHYMLRRGVFYSHRGMDKILDTVEQNREFVLYMGRGPSGPVHLGHLIPWLFTKHFQGVFGAKLLFQFTDDERIFIREDIDEKRANHWVLQNAIDLMALGFDPDNTEFIVNTRHTHKIYSLALKIAKRATGSTVRSVFGFNDQSNPGIIFFTSMQAAPCFLETERRKTAIPCLIPTGIDQDPYWRVTRDIAKKLQYPKPAQIHNRMLPGLNGDAKMSSSKPMTTIYTTDIPELVEIKIMDAGTAALPESCPMFLYRFLLLTESDEEINQLHRECTDHCISCEECKAALIKQVNTFLDKHRRRRTLIKHSVERMLE